MCFNFFFYGCFLHFCVRSPVFQKLFFLSRRIDKTLLLPFLHYRNNLEWKAWTPYADPLWWWYNTIIEKSIQHIMVMLVRSKRGLLFYSHRILNYTVSSSSSNCFHCWALLMPSDTDHFASHCEYLHTLHRRLKCRVGLPDTTNMASVGVWVTVSGHFKLPGTRRFLKNILFKLSDVSFLKLGVCSFMTSCRSNPCVY
mgnify:CR=1 FL=1